MGLGLRAIDRLEKWESIEREKKIILVFSWDLLTATNVLNIVGMAVFNRLHAEDVRFSHYSTIWWWHCFIFTLILVQIFTDIKHFFHYRRDDQGNLSGDDPQLDVHVAEGSESPNSYLDQECRGRFPLVEEDAILYCYEYDQNQEVSSVRRGSTPTYGKTSALSEDSRL